MEPRRKLIAPNEKQEAALAVLKQRPVERSTFALGAVALWLAVISAGAVWWFLKQDQLLWYGDAAAHLNIARRIVDSRTPGLDQIGTGWLPLPHLLMVPFVGDHHLWRTGLAGSIPSAVCFVLAGVLLFISVRRIFDSEAAGLAAVSVFALNPNLLYLQSIPMTESMWFAALAGLLYTTVRFNERRSLIWAALAGIAALVGTQIRYEAWFIVAFVYVWMLFQAGLTPALLFGAIAGLGPVSWLAHNWWYYGDALEFYHGPYSAKAIARSGNFPGAGDWDRALLYVSEASRLAAGTVLFWIGMPGAVVALAKRVVWPVVLLTAPPAFYVWSMHSGISPIHMPHREPFSYYNTRYGTALFPLLALGSAALVALAPRRFQPLAAGGVVAAAVIPWFMNADPNAWAVWKESQVNSESRRVWTRQAAQFLRTEAKPHDTIFMAFGDQTGILQQAGIPLRRTLHDGNNPHWLAAHARPDLFLSETWAIAISGDKVWRTMRQAPGAASRYRRVRTIWVDGAPPVEIYHRESTPAPQTEATPAQVGAEPGPESPPNPD